MPQHGAYDHQIELKPDAPAAINCRVYPMSPEEDKQLDKFIEENKRLGQIVRTDSPYASGFFFIKKKDGKLRPVQDYLLLPKHMAKLLRSGKRCGCAPDWFCLPHDACFVHESCFCEGSGAFPPCKPPRDWVLFSRQWLAELLSSRRV
jgi:hypothetical protein